MQAIDYLHILVDQLHTATVATIGSDGHPQTRVIDMMYYDDEGLYFLTAKGKRFYQQLMEQKFVAISATKDHVAISLRGEVVCIGSAKLDIIFAENVYMQQIYPQETRAALVVFCLHNGQGEYFNLQNPSCIERDVILLGQQKLQQVGYFVGAGCTGCRLCYFVCPQKCINFVRTPVVIEQNHCLHCGQCVEVCPVQAIQKRG